MGANELQQSLLDAMDLLSNKAANSTNAAITIKGEIIEELDSSVHQYKVSYGGAVYKDVYSIANASYIPSTIVWILIPDGNFDNPKIILGATAPSATQYVTEEIDDMYVPISDNLFGSVGNVNLKSWKDSLSTVATGSSNFGAVFEDYLTTYRNFLFTAYIKTDIDKDHQVKGDYGLILNLPFKEQVSPNVTTQVWKSYVMGVSTMQGNPYAFNEYQRVNLYYSIDDSLTYDTSRKPYIQSFVEGFGYLQDRTDVTYDIFIKDIAVKMVDVLTEKDASGYYLGVIASEGNYFFGSDYSSTKTLKPILKINGKEANIKEWSCYWFVEDTSIDITKEDYQVLGGIGWKCLNKKTNITYDIEGNKNFQYITNNYTYQVDKSDVTSALRYKCVLVKDDIVVGGSVRLKNLSLGIITQLVSATGSNTFVENIGNVRILARIYYNGVTNATKPTITISTAWQRFDKDGNYLDNNFYTLVKNNEQVTINGKVYYETEISYPCTKLESLNNIKCTFYSTTTKNGTVVQNNLGTEEIIVTTSPDFTYGMMITGGDVLYKYDSDGDSPMVADYDGPASSKITTINPISFKVFKPDGSELSDVEYLYTKYRWSFPKNSMMKLAGYTTQQLNALEQDNDYYYITGYGISSINYTILTTYNKKKSDNSILLQIEMDGCTLNDSVSPKFLKDGEGGTNGSKYSVILTYGNYAYGEKDGNGRIRKLQAVYINGVGWKLYDIPNNKLIDFGSPKLVVNVYRDGEKITAAGNYSVVWRMFDSTTTSPCFTTSNGTISIQSQWTNVDSIYCSIVECQVTITEESVTNSQEVVYAYYPIEITRLLSNSMANNVIPTLDGGFDDVVYASDGTNPQYDNTNPFSCTNNLYKDDEGDHYDYAWSGSTNLKIPSGTGPTSSIKPVTKFDNGLTKNYVKVRLTMSATKRTELNTLINQVNTNITATTNKINFYQHDKQHILDFVEKFEYNNYIGYLNTAKKLLGYRFDMLNIIPSLNDILDDMYNYCTVVNNISLNDFNYNKYRSDYSSDLDLAYQNLYFLGYSTTLANIKDLANRPIEVNKDVIVNKYGISVYNQLQSYADSWEGLIVNKYQVYFKKITNIVNKKYELINEYNALHTFDNNIITFSEDSDLDYLSKTHDGNAATQDYVNLKNQLITLMNNIKSVNGNLISYSAFVSNLLDRVTDLLTIYKNTAYINQYYQGILDELNQQLTDYQKTLVSYQQLLLPASSDYIIHIKPIVMVSNRYELSQINGWDGSKLYTGGTNEEYLLAPQVGAGAKKNGLFTGVLMGVKQFNKVTTQHIGLFGYSSGIQSLFINAEDGSAIFGKSGGGQITIDPDGGRGYLYSANYWNQYKDDGKPSSYADSNKAYKGMLINLTDSLIHLGSAESGRIYSGHHSSLGNTDTGFYLSHDGLSIGKYFTVYTGANNTDQNGQAVINQEQSTLGDWRIKTVTVYDSNGNSSQRRCFVSKLDSSGNFNDGIILDSANSTIVLGSPENGRIYSGEHYKLNNTKDGFYIGRDGLSIGSAFVVNTDGTATVEHDGSSIGQWKIRQVEVTDTAGNKSTKQCITSKNNQEGIYLDATNSTIVLGSSSGRIYSGQHYQWSSKTEGFYISDQGLSIGEDFYVQGKNTGGQAAGTATVNQENSTIGQWKINTVQIQTGVDANDEPVYKTVKSIVSNKNQGIFLDAPDSTIVLGSSQGKIYSGKHYQLGSTKEGFYLSNEGLSIGSNFTIVSDGTSNITHENSNIGQWKLTGDGTNQKLASTRNGILLDAPNSRIIIGGSEGEIYSGTHTTLDSIANGFYLSNQGLSIGSKVYISQDGVLRLGYGAVAGTNKHWTINGDGSNSYISYGSKGSNGSVYIGTNEIHLGSKLRLYNDGSLEGGTNDSTRWEIDSAGNANFRSLTADRSGSIAGWEISSSSLSSSGITISSSGSIHSDNWSINGSGNAYFNDITCNNVWSFGSGSNTWSSGSGFSFGWGGLNGSASISLGASPAYGNNGLSVDTSGNTRISGTIYANAGEINGDLVVHGTVKARYIDCEGVITAREAQIKKLAADEITADYIQTKISSINMLNAKGITCTSLTTNGGIYNASGTTILTSLGKAKSAEFADGVNWGDVRNAPDFSSCVKIGIRYNCSVSDGIITIFSQAG